MLDGGLGGALAPIDNTTTPQPGQILVDAAAWQDLEFEVALDSGAVVHVCTPAACPGYFYRNFQGADSANHFW